MAGPAVVWTSIADQTPETVPSLTLTGPAGIVVKNLRVSGARYGIDVHTTAGPAVLESVLVEAATGLGVSVHPFGELEAHDLVVRDTAAGPGAEFGFGLYVERGGVATLTRAVFERNRTFAIDVLDPGSSVSGEDVAVRDTLPRASDGAYGLGLHAGLGGHVDLSRAVLEGNQAAAVRVLETGTDVVFTDVVVRATRTHPTTLAGYAFEIGDGAHVTLERTLLDANRAAAVLLVGATLDMTDVVVRDTAARDDGYAGNGIEARGAGAATIERVAVLRNHGSGLLFGEAATLSATDVLVADTLPQPADDAFGDGIEAFGGATMELVRVSLDGNTSLGLLVNEAGTQVSGTDVAIRDTRSRASDGLTGYGLQVAYGAAVDLERVDIVGSHGAGALVSYEGTAHLRTLLVEGTLDGTCGGAPCGLGSGIVVRDGASLVASDFRISDNEVCGIQIVSAAEADLTGGEVSRNAVGANVQVEGFDLARIQNAVVYVDNDVTLDATVLPVPDAEAL